MMFSQTDRLVSLRSKKLKGKSKNCGFGLKAETEFIVFCDNRKMFFFANTYVNIETNFGQFEMFSFIKLHFHKNLGVF
jgi:hypothetical protein